MAIAARGVHTEECVCNIVMPFKRGERKIDNLACMFWLTGKKNKLESKQSWILSSLVNKSSTSIFNMVDFNVAAWDFIIQ